VANRWSRLALFSGHTLALGALLNYLMQRDMNAVNIPKAFQDISTPPEKEEEEDKLEKESGYSGLALLALPMGAAAVGYGLTNMYRKRKRLQELKANIENLRQQYIEQMQQIGGKSTDIEEEDDEKQASMKKDALISDVVALGTTLLLPTAAYLVYQRLKERKSDTDKQIGAIQNALAEFHRQQELSA